jgi:hypothetical protein
MYEVYMQVRTEQVGKSCGCGRSPTGECVGWHNLTNEQFQVKLNEWNSSQNSGKQLLSENKGID